MQTIPPATCTCSLWTCAIENEPIVTPTKAVVDARALPVQEDVKFGLQLINMDYFHSFSYGYPSMETACCVLLPYPTMPLYLWPSMLTTQSSFPERSLMPPSLPILPPVPIQPPQTAPGVPSPHRTLTDEDRRQIYQDHEKYHAAYPCNFCWMAYENAHLSLPCRYIPVSNQPLWYQNNTRQGLGEHQIQNSLHLTGKSTCSLKELLPIASQSSVNQFIDRNRSFQG